MEDPRSLALKKLKLLISLAQIDGAIAEQEIQFIYNIGLANGLKRDEIEPLFERVHALVIPANLPEDDRFRYLLSMVQLMKADEKMFKEELLFCKKVAENLGYNQDVLVDMLLHVKATGMTGEEEQQLKGTAKQYLR